mmetsp:Transcript_25624/g.40146  ORF Transcript_25624/g.40146 Transcript_25624/m.40146 type:complete len:219 (+) Transcript_25624:798-1454(+)
MLCVASWLTSLSCRLPFHYTQPGFTDHAAREYWMNEAQRLGEENARLKSMLTQAPDPESFQFLDEVKQVDDMLLREGFNRNTIRQLVSAIHIGRLPAQSLEAHHVASLAHNVHKRSHKNFRFSDVQMCQFAVLYKQETVQQLMRFRKYGRSKRHTLTKKEARLARESREAQGLSGRLEAEPQSLEGNLQSSYPPVPLQPSAQHQNSNFEIHRSMLLTI